MHAFGFYYYIFSCTNGKIVSSKTIAVRLTTVLMVLHHFFTFIMKTYSESGKIYVYNICTHYLRFSKIVLPVGRSCSETPMSSWLFRTYLTTSDESKIPNRVRYMHQCNFIGKAIKICTRVEKIQFL